MLNAINVLLVALLFYVFVSVFKMLTIYGGGASEQCATAATTLHDVGLLSNLAADMVADPAVHHTIYVFETTPGLIHRSDEELLADNPEDHKGEGVAHIGPRLVTAPCPSAAAVMGGPLPDRLCCVAWDRFWTCRAG